MNQRTKFGLAGAIVLCAIAGLLAYFLRAQKQPASKPSGERIVAVINDIMPVGEFYRGPALDPAMTEVAFTRSAAGGRKLFFLNAATGEESVFGHKNEIEAFGGYSPDGKWFLFKSMSHGGEVTFIYDRQTRKDNPSRLVNGHLKKLMWLSPTNYVASYDSASNCPALAVISIGTKKPKRPQRFFLTNDVLTLTRASEAMTRMSSNAIAFADGLDLWRYDFGVKTQTLLLHLTNNVDVAEDEAPGVGHAQWLNFCEANRSFLFCTYDGSNWRHVFKFRKNGDTNIVEQLTFNNDHSYNAEWIQNGTGFAFVGSHTNHFFLGIRPSDPQLATNLFTHVLGYTVSADGDQIVATASIDAEPPGIWLYRISTKELRRLSKPIAFKAAKIVRRQEQRVRSFDGLNVTCFLTAPTDLDPTRKYPAIISTPPMGNQFYQAWEKYSQMLANLGVYNLAVNHRGIDGYGNFFRQQDDADAYKDVMSAYEQLLKNPNVDRDRIFLMSWSSGCQVINKLVAEYPGRWAGIINHSGAPPAMNRAALKNTRVLLFVGGKEKKELLEAHQAFKDWAQTNGVKVESIRAAQTSHVITDVATDAKLSTAILDFVWSR